MSVLENIIKFMQFEMQKPKLYGWFHIMCLIIMIFLVIILSNKKVNSKKMVLVCSIIMIVFEIYKQLSFSFINGVWSYQWYIFPFQFCSVPMYVGFIAGITKNKKLEKILYSFLSTYAVCAGVAVMLYPSTVFVSEVMINIQTMVHHGFMAIIGLCLIIKGNVELNKSTLFNGLKVFIILVLIALSLNILTYYIDLNNGFELFFISPFKRSTLPIFDIIYDKVPYIIFLFIYITVFTFGSYIPIVIAKKIKKKTT